MNGTGEGVRTRQVEVNGSRCRVLEKGSGKPLVVLAGHGGVPRWSPFHELLAARRTVVVPSLPGQQGSDRGHEALHNPLDWLAMTLDLLDACGLEGPVDLVAESVAAMLAGELAVFSPARLRKLVLAGPYGLYDEAEPTVNLYALAPSQRPGYLLADQQKYSAQFGPLPGGEEAATEEFNMIAYRADEAIARLGWPFGDFKLVRRLHRVRTPVLLLWGAGDRLVPPAYAQRFARLLPGESRTRIVPNAGHLVSVDAPEETAEAVLGFLEG